MSIGLKSLLLILAGAASLWVTSCSRPASQTSSHQAQARHLPKDDIGRDIILKGVPHRIVTIGPGVTETVFALDAGDRLVGRDQISDYPPGKFPHGVQGIPVVGDYSGPFFEKVVSARPDLIIAQGETLDRARVDTWQEKCGAPVAVVGAHNLKEVAQDIEKMGAWIGNLGIARKLAAAVRLADGKSVTRGPRVFLQVQRTPLWTVGKGTLVGDVLRAAGCTNIAEDINGYQEYSLETLTAKNPEYYIVPQNVPPGKTNQSLALKELRLQPALRNLKCVRDGRVIVIPGDYILRPGPRLVQGVNLLREEIRKFEQKK